MDLAANLTLNYKHIYYHNVITKHIRYSMHLSVYRAIIKIFNYLQRKRARRRKMPAQSFATECLYSQMATNMVKLLCLLNSTNYLLIISLISPILDKKIMTHSTKQTNT